MYNLSLALQAFGNMFKSLFDFLKIQKEHQNQTEILIDKNKLKMASNTAEEIIANTDVFFIWVANLCWDIMSFRQRRQYTHFLRKHKKLKKRFEKND